MNPGLSTCPWASSSGDQLMTIYHDTEWGVPVHDDNKHFEYFLLDCFQAGLSWKTVLHKRENFRKAFESFDIRKVARFGPDKIATLMTDPGIIRNKAKILATIRNAALMLDICKELGSFDAYIWQFTGGKTLHHHYSSTGQIPSSSKESDVMSKDLYQRGFRFVGSVICYSYMQAAGLVNDHMTYCQRYTELRTDR